MYDANYVAWLEKFHPDCLPSIGKLLSCYDHFAMFALFVDVLYIKSNGMMDPITPEDPNLSMIQGPSNDHSGTASTAGSTSAPVVTSVSSNPSTVQGPSNDHSLTASTAGSTSDQLVTSVFLIHLQVRYHRLVAETYQ